MRVAQSSWTVEHGWRGDDVAGPFSLVLAFGAPAALERDALLDALRARYGGAPLLCCSTAGEILGDAVIDDAIVATAIGFDHTTVRGIELELERSEDSRRIGEQLGAALEADDLSHIFVLSDGVRVNGSELARGLGGTVRPGVRVTGGLAADGARFARTLVGWNHAPASGRVAAVGFYGRHLHVGCGSLGGWDPFGPERVVTRAIDNVLYEVDGESALALYKKYLGPHAADLPASALLFPLSLRATRGGSSVVRTVLAIREEDDAMVFAGDVPVGAQVRLMRANFERLIDGATGAAESSARQLETERTELAILISCVGRKLVLGQRVEEEIDGVRGVFGPAVPFIGFYSNGEISPSTPDACCDLHNLTMTITTFGESAP